MGQRRDQKEMREGGIQEERETLKETHKESYTKERTLG